MKYHVVKISTCGLGDAIKSVIVGAIYAELCNRTLIVDWRKSVYASGEENTFFELFELKNIPHQVQTIDSADVAPSRWQNRLNKSLDEVYQQDDWPNWDRTRMIKAYSVDLEDVEYEQNVTVSWDFDQAEKLLSQLTQFESLDQLYMHGFQKYLIVKPSIKSRVEKLKNKLPKDYLAAHIRNTQEFSDNKGHTSVSRYLRAIQLHQYHEDNPFFLASDNIDVQNRLKDEHGKLVFQEKWFAEAGEALHLSDRCPDKLENAKRALIDILVLANAKVLVCNSRSCFAQCARYFSPIAKQTIVDVLQPLSLMERLRSIFRILKTSIFKSQIS